MRRSSLLIVVALSLLTACGPTPMPTPDVAATDTAIAHVRSATLTAQAPTETPTQMLTSTPTNTATSTPTFTPVPTDTPTLTNTPTLTLAPTPTPTPTDTPLPPTPTSSPTMDADPTVYDNFNNPANEGGYDKGLWEPIWLPAGGQVAQQDGVMMITQWGKPTVGTEMVARKYRQFSLDRPTFFEAKLMLSPDTKTVGNVHLALFTELSPNEPWYSECNIGDGEGGKVVAECFEGIPLEGIPEEWQYRYWAEEIIPVQSGSWYTVRMEVDPATMTFSYFVDGRFVGSHTSHHADRLKKAGFRRLEIGVYAGATAGPEDVLTGYVDDVRVGPLQ